MDVHTILHPLDQIGPRCYIRGLLCFPFDGDRDACATALQRALTELITQSPSLAGTVKLKADESEKLVLTHSILSAAKALDVKIWHDFPYSYRELQARDMPQSALPLSFGPFDVFRPDLSEPVPVLGVRANFISGGLVLAIYAHHAVVDGFGYALIVQRLAANYLATKFQSHNESIEAATMKAGDVFSRHTPRTTGGGSNIPGYPVYDLSPSSHAIGVHPVSASVPPAHRNVVRTLVFRRAALQTLKQRLNSRPANLFSKLSLYDTILALMWARVTAARVRAGITPTDTTTTSQLIYPTDIRRTLSLPEAFIHNGGIRTLTEAVPVLRFSPDSKLEAQHGSMETEITSPTPSRSSEDSQESFTSSTLESTQDGLDINPATETLLSDLAAHVRHATDSIISSPARTSEVLSLIGSLKNVRALQRPPGTHIGLSGQYDLMFTSWSRMPLYDCHFGRSDSEDERALGSPEFVRVCPHVPAGWDGLGYIMPTRSTERLRTAATAQLGSRSDDSQQIMIDSNGDSESEVEVVMGLRGDVMDFLCQDHMLMQFIDRVIE